MNYYLLRIFFVFFPAARGFLLPAPALFFFCFFCFFLVKALAGASIFGLADFEVGFEVRFEARWWPCCSGWMRAASSSVRN